MSVEKKELVFWKTNDVYYLEGEWAPPEIINWAGYVRCRSCNMRTYCRHSGDACRCGGAFEPDVVSELEFQAQGSLLGAPRPTLPEALFAVPSDVLEAVLQKLPNQVTDQLQYRHFFGEGTYAREITIPIGTLLTARRYKVPHVCICSAGTITVWEDGVDPVEISAPFTYVGKPGARRKGYAHEETVWTTILPNPEGLTDPEAVLDLYAEIPEIPQALLDMSPPEVLKAFFGGALGC